jgi:hypothetical protein
MYLSKHVCCFRLVFPKILLCCFLIFPLALFAQQNDSLKISTANLQGALKGKVKDSVYNFMLTSATIAVYKAQDSSLVQFCLPNNFGEFIVQPLPVALPLRLIITHVGYLPYIKNFTLTKENPTTDMGLLYMYQNSDKNGNLLEEVIVTAVPPVRMNGDTLEFNPRAFKMDANATAEDWMRLLPGLTIWGDGEVTVYGKKIPNILVDGKPFMGGGTTIATQNLPVDAVDKLQVYQQRDEKNPLDSTLFANIKLKENKKLGYFGKLSAGYGLPAWSKDKTARYATDGMLSGFNKKMQISTVGAFNNINKLANSVDVLMRNTTFKGEGADMEYQSDFNRRGLNRPLSAGAQLQYDFIPDVQYRKYSRLNVDYFINDNPVTTNNNTFTNTFLSNDTLLSRNSINHTYQHATDQNFNAHYSKSTDKGSLNLSASFGSNYNKTESSNNSVQEKTGIGVISNSSSINENESDRKRITAGFSYIHSDYYRGNAFSSKRRIPRRFTVEYRFGASIADGNSRSQTEYTYPLKPENNRTFDRLYTQRDEQSNSHNIKVSYPDLRQLIFNKRNFGGIDINLSSGFDFVNNINTDKVLDLDTLTNTYRINNYLTNERRTHSQNFTPSISFSRNFYKGLTNRYNKYVSIIVNAVQQYYGMKSNATQTVQNFSYQYSRFVPTASVEYYNHQYGNHEMRYKLGFSTGVYYPDVQDIAPLVDSSNYWYVPKGNPNLQPQYKKELTASYSFQTRTPQNPLIINVDVTAGKTEHDISDSVLYSDDGVRTVYKINMDGNRYTRGAAKIKKSLELNKEQTTLEAEASYNFSQGRNPGFLNSVLNSSNSINQNTQLAFSFRLRDLLTLKTETGFSTYNSVQKGFNNTSFKSNNQYLRAIGSLQFPKNLVWNSNITYNKSGGNNIKSVYFTIWNAGITYRFLKGNRGEVKFSALDLLRQNKGIINTSNGNTQTFTTANVLQQYYMLTLAYYPRQFGKKIKGEAK